MMDDKTKKYLAKKFAFAINHESIDNDLDWCNTVNMPWLALSPDWAAASSVGLWATITPRWGSDRCLFACGGSRRFADREGGGAVRSPQRY